MGAGADGRGTSGARARSEGLSLSAGSAVQFDGERACLHASKDSRTALHFTSVVSELSAQARSVTARYEEQSVSLGVSSDQASQTRGSWPVPAKRQVDCVLLRESTNENRTGQHCQKAFLILQENPDSKVLLKNNNNNNNNLLKDLVAAGSHPCTVDVRPLEKGWRCPLLQGPPCPLPSFRLLGPLRI